MAISRENMPQNNNPSGALSPKSSRTARSSRPSGVVGNPISSRPTGVAGNMNYDSSEDEMRYGRIVKIIKAKLK